VLQCDNHAHTINADSALGTDILIARYESDTELTKNQNNEMDLRSSSFGLGRCNPHSSAWIIAVVRQCDI
jgi:hypothetical protein